MLGGLGLLSVRRARRFGFSRGKRVLAAFPLLFALQQAAERLVWLCIDGRAPPALHLPATLLFLFFALFVWPVAGPVAGWLIETRPARRRLFAPLVAAGLAAGLYLFGAAALDPVPPTSVAEFRGHISYLQHLTLLPRVEYLYFVVAAAALVFSSDPQARRFGLALAASFLVARALYQTPELPSVWSYFAAWISLFAIPLRPAPRPENAA